MFYLYEFIFYFFVYRRFPYLFHFCFLYHALESFLTDYIILNILVFSCLFPSVCCQIKIKIYQIYFFCNDMGKTMTNRIILICLSEKYWIGVIKRYFVYGCNFWRQFEGEIKICFWGSLTVKKRSQSRLKSA